MEKEDQSIPKRWSAQRKSAAVLRLIQGEPIDQVSRELAIPISRLEEWRDQALQGMVDSLKDRIKDPLEAELQRAKRQLGEAIMENELLKERCKKLPFRKGRLRK